MSEAPPVERCPVAEQVAREATLLVTRQWFAEAVKISEATTDPSARWELLLVALRRVGWPGRV